MHNLSALAVVTQDFHPVAEAHGYIAVFGGCEGSGRSSCLNALLSPASIWQRGGQPIQQTPPAACPVGVPRPPASVVLGRGKADDRC